MSAAAIVPCYCGALMVQRDSRFGLFFACSVRGCDGKVGCHPDGRPKGTPGNHATRQARIRAHAAFDPLWKSRAMSRKSAYAWLKESTGVVHIAESDIDQCERVVRACEQREGAAVAGEKSE